MDPPSALTAMPNPETVAIKESGQQVKAMV
jgi:hypothetical protein